MNNTKRILITGIQGFLGKYLYRYLLKSENCEIFGIDRIPDILGMSGGRYIQEDLVSPVESNGSVIDDIKPELIFHLAGITHGDDPALFYENNFFAAYRLCERLHRLKSGQYDPQIVVLGTSAEYGARARIANTEKDELQPVSHYGVSKALQTYIVQLFDRLRWLKIIIARPSNIIGPGQPSKFIIPDFAREIAKIEKGIIKAELTIRNGSVVRDFIDVRDVVRALKVLTHSGKFGGIYNISSNYAVSVRELAEELRALAKIPVAICEEHAAVNSDAIPVQTSDNAKIRKETGWKPEIPFQQSIGEILDEQRKALDEEMR